MEILVSVIMGTVSDDSVLLSHKTTFVNWIKRFLFSSIAWPISQYWNDFSIFVEEWVIPVEQVDLILSGGVCLVSFKEGLVPRWASPKGWWENTRITCKNLGHPQQTFEFLMCTLAIYQMRQLGPSKSTHSPKDTQVWRGEARLPRAECSSTNNPLPARKMGLEAIW